MIRAIVDATGEIPTEEADEIGHRCDGTAGAHLETLPEVLVVTGLHEDHPAATTEQDQATQGKPIAIIGLCF